MAADIGQLLPLRRADNGKAEQSNLSIMEPTGLPEGSHVCRSIVRASLSMDYLRPISSFPGRSPFSAAYGDAQRLVTDGAS